MADMDSLTQKFKGLGSDDGETGYEGAKDHILIRRMEQTVDLGERKLTGNYKDLLAEVLTRCHNSPEFFDQLTQTLFGKKLKHNLGQSKPLAHESTRAEL